MTHRRYMPQPAEFTELGILHTLLRRGRAAHRSGDPGGNRLADPGHRVLVTALPQEAFAAADILALYRLRWRIELAFKRLKTLVGLTLVGLKRPPGTEARSATPYVLAHLLMILWLAPLVDALEASPRLAAA